MKTSKILLALAGFVIFFVGAFFLFNGSADMMTGSFIYSPDINIINQNNNIALNSNLNIDFTTTGIFDLVITPLKGEAQFIELKCNAQLQNPISKGKRVIYENYNCNGRSSISFKVQSNEIELEFGFGNKLEYANNIAP